MASPDKLIKQDAGCSVEGTVLVNTPVQARKVLFKMCPGRLVENARSQ
jgi:hypothetical protein